MSVPAVSVPGETSFLEIVRTLSREHLGAVPVVDADGRVIGVVSESDLLAKAAAQVAVLTPVRFAASGSTACTRRAAGRPRPPS